MPFLDDQVLMGFATILFYYHLWKCCYFMGCDNWVVIYLDLLSLKHRLLTVPGVPKWWPILGITGSLLLNFGYLTGTGAFSITWP